MMSDLNDEVTPRWMYLNRRQWMRGGAMAASVVATAGLYRWLNPANTTVAERRPIDNLQSRQDTVGPDASPSPNAGAGPTAGAANNTNVANANQANANQDANASDNPTSELNPTNESSKSAAIDDPLQPDDVMTAERFILNYNNFYEFTTSKTQVAALAANFRTTGWQLEVDGLVDKPRKFTIDELHALSRPKERIYRMRCVEGWSMVIPWVGIELSHLLQAVQPKSNARFVAFETLFDPVRMPGQKVPVLQWPYIEGLRIDEAMHRLTILATGLYGKELPPQDGAPVRLVVPWKYGFKGIKSIVRISLVAEQPETSWNLAAPREYGFYANVNPNVDHPRWSQATEQRIGEIKRRPTLMFNGYAEQVADLYRDMDLKKFF